jgi:hypothetical protein
LGGAAPVFDTSIRYLESAAVDMRSRGLLPYELAELHQGDKTKRIKQLRKGVKVNGENSLLSRDSSAAGLAGDYAGFAAEVLAAISVQESRARVEVAV